MEFKVFRLTMSVVNPSLDDLDGRLALLQQSMERTKEASALRISDTTDPFDIEEEELRSKLTSLRRTRANTLSTIKSETRDQLRVFAQEVQQVKVQRNRRWSCKYDSLGCVVCTWP